ncbi:MAG TPA: Ger(x)C family spore germination protein [Ruminiclostridium sp.]|jgi:spore germination protein KC|nr:Ger(x)C family spore germination protein [Ruminiclostridium sp.]
MKKRLLLLPWIMMIALFSTSCWNYKDVENLDVVAGCAIDKTGEGHYTLTVEMINMVVKGRESQPESVILETEGETILDAIRNSISISSPKLYWSHATCLILGQDVASEGIKEILDIIFRDEELRVGIHLFVSEGKTAKELFDAKVLTAVIKSFEIDRRMADEGFLSKSFPVQAYRFIDVLSEEGISGVLPSICITEQKGEKMIELCGSAVFKEDKLLGFLDKEETKSLNFILNNIKGGVIPLKESSDGGAQRISLEILKNKTDIEPMYINNKPSIQINIETEVSLKELNKADNTITQKDLEFIEKEAGNRLKTDIEGFISKVQKKYNSDIFGFGRSFYKNKPSVWKKISHQWKNIFKDLEVKVKPTIRIMDSGMTNTYIHIGD